MTQLTVSAQTFLIGTSLAISTFCATISAQDAANAPAQTPSAIQPATPPAVTNIVTEFPHGGLTLEEALRRVIIHNESLQMKLLDAEIARRQFKSEKGVFEPAIVGSYERVDSKRENTEEQKRQLFGPGSTAPDRFLFNERNDLMNGGLEFLTPLGSKFRLGYDLKHLRNNLNIGVPEWVTTAGATLTQPLLKNFGTVASMARIRLAAINSDIAYQDYRRQMMLTLTRAEAAYWDLYLTQEQARLSEESVRIAESLYKDNKSRLEAGKSSELEVLQAEAGLSLRRSRRSEAGQKMSEAVNQLWTLFSGNTVDTNAVLRATDQPGLRELAMDYYESYRSAFDKNPDYLTRKHQALAENVRLSYAKNQLLPALDLKGSYGLNGLGTTPYNSFSDVERTQFPAWSVGVEFRIPITGGIKERNDYKAAQLSKQKALVGLKEIEVQIGNALNTAILKVNNLRDSVQSQTSVINFHQQLLETQLARLDVGLIDSRTVLDTEEKLFEAKVALLDSVIQYQKSLLEFQLVKGTVLAEHGLEISKAELQEQTSRLLAAQSFSGPEFDNLKKELNEQYKYKLHHLNANEKKENIIQSIFQ